MAESMKISSISEASVMVVLWHEISSFLGARVIKRYARGELVGTVSTRNSKRLLGAV